MWARLSPPPRRVQALVKSALGVVPINDVEFHASDGGGVLAWGAAQGRAPVHSSTLAPEGNADEEVREKGH
jgi:hypothetical protein